MWLMDVELLRTFLAAARLGSLRRAADELFLAPPTVTVHIRRLERATGCRLFERGGRGVRLTPAGWWLLPRAQAAVRELDAAAEGLAAFRQGAGERVTLAVSPFVARTVLPAALAGLRAERPDLDFAVDVLLSVEIAAAVAQGRADLGLSLLPAPRGGAVRSDRLWAEPVALVVPSAGAGAEPGGRDWRAVVRGNRLLTGSHPAFWEDLLGALRRMGVLGRTMPVTDMDITRRFIAEGLGVSFLPPSVVREEVASGRMATVPTDGLAPPVSEVFAVWAWSGGRPRGAGAGGGDGPPPAGGGTDGARVLVAALRRIRGV